MARHPLGSVASNVAAIAVVAVLRMGHDPKVRPAIVQLASVLVIDLVAISPRQAKDLSVHVDRPASRPTPHRVALVMERPPILGKAAVGVVHRCVGHDPALMSHRDSHGYRNGTNPANDCSSYLMHR
jgi:hypothetical protein